VKLGHVVALDLRSSLRILIVGIKIVGIKIVSEKLKVLRGATVVRKVIALVGIA
jgi:hypothetical protein